MLIIAPSVSIAVSLPRRQLRRLVLRLATGRGRPVVELAYALVLRSVCRLLRGGADGSAVYACGSFGRNDVVLGLSDLDVAVVVPDDAASIAGAEHRRALLGRLPLVRDAVHVAVYDAGALERVAGTSILTYGERGSAGGAAYGGAIRGDALARLERPRMEAPLAGCRLLTGSDLRPRVGEPPGPERRLAAWLELQYWWTNAFRACLHPELPDTALLCVKLVAEPARIWLWLVHGERSSTRRRALEEALERLPEESDVLRDALLLHDDLPAERPPPVASAVAALARLSQRLAEHIRSDVAESGATEVRLLGDRAQLVPANGDGAAGDGGVPLADWRARVFSPDADELLVLHAGDPGDPKAIAAAARAERRAIVPALAADGLLALPTAGARLGRARLRAVQCPDSDPVSFALLGGRRAALFPNVPGWSAADCARRAVDEHRPRLDDAEGSRSLERLLNAVRASVFAESLADGDPVLPLTVAATVAELGRRRPAARSVLAEAEASFRSLRLEATEPAHAVVDGLRTVARRLPAYRVA